MENVIRREAERVMSRTAKPQMGVVSGYDPARYAAKVRLQPSDTETGWLPVATTWSGSGWGDYNPPSPGDVVDVHFQEGNQEAGFVSQRFYSAVTQPLAVPSGESWRVHQSGSCIKFKNDGSVEIHAATAISSSASIWNHAGDIVVTGDILVTGDIRDLNGTYNTLNSLRNAYNSHHHLNTQSGSGTSGTTDIIV